MRILQQGVAQEQDTVTTAKHKSMPGTIIILMKYIFNSKNVFLFYLPIKFGFGVDGFVTRTASGVSAQCAKGGD